jgi:hypothetical protein
MAVWPVAAAYPHPIRVCEGNGERVPIRSLRASEVCSGRGAGRFRSLLIGAAPKASALALHESLAHAPLVLRRDAFETRSGQDRATQLEGKHPSRASMSKSAPHEPGFFLEADDGTRTHDPWVGKCDDGSRGCLSATRGPSKTCAQVVAHGSSMAVRTRVR